MNRGALEDNAERQRRLRLILGTPQASGNQQLVSNFFGRVAADGGQNLLTPAEIQALIPRGDWSWFYVPSGRKAGTSYAEIPQNGAGDLTMTRASVANAFARNGTLTEVAANVGRLDFFNGAFLGQPIEPLATNGYWPSAINGAGWTPTGATISGNVLTETTANSTHRIEGSFRAASINQLRAYSYIFRRQSGPDRTLRISVSNGIDGDAFSGFFNTITGARVTAATRSGSWSATGFDSGCINLGGGYFLLYVVAQTTAGTTNRITADLGSSSGVSTYVGDTSSSHEIIGVQMETGTFPTSRITTIGAIATRQADQFTRTSASGLIGSGALTLYAELNSRLTDGANAKRILTLTDGTANNVVALEKTSIDRIRAVVINGGVEQVSIISGTSPTGNIRVAMGLNTNDSVLYVNGAEIGTDTSVAIPSGLNRIDLGQSSLNALQLNDRIRAAGLSQRRWSNNELANLTRI